MKLGIALGLFALHMTLFSSEMDGTFEGSQRAQFSQDFLEEEEEEELIVFDDGDYDEDDSCN